MSIMVFAIPKIDPFFDGSHGSNPNLSSEVILSRSYFGETAAEIGRVRVAAEVVELVQRSWVQVWDIHGDIMGI